MSQAANAANNFLQGMRKTQGQPFQVKTNLQSMTGSPAKQLPMVIPDEITNLLGQLGNTINKLASHKLNNKVLQPQDRRSRGAYPVASKIDGSILYSDGSVEQTPQSQRLLTLKSNVLAQQNFTPEAQDYLNKIPITYGASGRALGEYYRGDGSNDQALGRIQINPDTFEHGAMLPGEVLTHEYLHALDANVNRDDFASYPANGNSSGDSYGFLDNYEDKVPVKYQEGLKNFLKSYPEDPYVYDQESFAQYAAPQANKVLLGPMGSSYSKIFNPSSKSLNFSPIYPTSTYTDILKSLDKQDAISDF